MKPTTSRAGSHEVGQPEMPPGYRDAVAKVLEDPTIMDLDQAIDAIMELIVRAYEAGKLDLLIGRTWRP